MMSQPLEDKNVENDDSICIDFGFKLDEVKEAVQYLDKGDRDEVKKLGFGTFLDLSIGDFKQIHRQPIDSLVRKVTVEKDRIAICMQDGVILYLTPEIISLLMNLPRGDKGPLDYNPQKNTVELANCRTELGVESLKVENVVEVLKKTKDRKLKVKCFMLLVISRILMPTTTTKTISTNAVMYTKRWTPLKTLTGAL